MGIRDRAYGVFHPGWVVTGIGVGLGLQLVGWITGVGLLGGLTGFLLMGVVVGWASPGNTVIEPGVAAFVVAAVGFVLDHLLLTLFVIGLPMALAYGAVGLALGVAGGWIGERAADAL